MDFQEIYKAYFQDVYRYLLSLCHDEHLAEEICAQTFFVALEKIHQFQGKSSMRVWLCQIAKNGYFSYLRKKKIPWIEKEPKPNPEEIFIHQEMVEEVTLAMEALPYPYEDVLRLRIYGELDFRRIGKIFGKSANWACVVYHRGRKKVQEKMEENNGL